MIYDRKRGMFLGSKKNRGINNQLLSNILDNKFHHLLEMNLMKLGSYKRC